MTNFILSADIHINLSKNSDFESSRFLKFMSILASEKADYYYLIGDVFDRPRPTLEEIDLFYQGISILHNDNPDAIVVITEGNHEVINKNLNTYSLLPELGFTYHDTGVIYEDKYHQIFMVGHQNIKGIINYADELKNKNTVLLSHIRCSLGLIKEEIKLKPIQEMFDKIILGDIHLHHSFDNVEYTSQPYNTTFSPVVDNGYISMVIDGPKIEYNYKKINLPNKSKLSIGVDSFESVVKTLDKDNLYALFVTGTADKLNDLPLKASNYSVHKIVATDEEALEEELLLLKNSGINNVAETLVGLTISLNDLPEETYREIGESILTKALDD